MKIVIAGAGDIGSHLAKLLSTEQQDIILIDSNKEVLDYVSKRLDVLTIKGDSSSIDVLQSAGVHKADLFLAVTTSENNNIVSSILAKKLGSKQTIARVNKLEYLCKEQKEIFSELGVDKLIHPVSLAASEIKRLIELGSVTDNFEFENGKISLIGVTLRSDSVFIGRSLREIDEMYPDMDTRPIAILRGQETILPRSNTIVKQNDHIYFISLKKDVERLIKIMGRKSTPINKVMIIGGTDLAFVTAKMLEEDYQVTIVEKTKSELDRLIDDLNEALIIKGDASNADVLREEGLAGMDAFIALSPNSETNIITSLMAEQEGVGKTIALVDHPDYTRISQHIGIDTLINKKLIAANNIFRFVRKGKIEAITSLHGVDAEIIEYIVMPNNKLINKPLRQVKFPKNAIIAGVIRGEQSIIPTGDFVLQPDDRTIVFAVSNSISQLEEIFR